ncbi:separase [Populus alba x Populus x berolinensis]|uniref:separase n=2 Tax=Populus alba x Populus x berolinensis TaxID=444605 RepID=A0AAD6R5T0_9ROSI|nr:separase [Populus alba x Populus x berolinensis]
MAASVEESSALISKLESPSISTPIYSPLSNYLLPFTDLSKKPLNQNQTLTLTRSLAKKFLPFVNRCLSILPKRLSDLLNSPSFKQDDGGIPELVIEMFDAYRLCLDCLESVASQLAGKPYAVYRQRLRLACCLDTWGLYREGENEGFRVLERLRGLDSGPKSKNNRKKKLGEYLPVLLEDGDLDFAKMVVEVAVAILKCVALGQSKNDEDYKRVIGMVHEVKPWFRVLDANSHEKLHRMLVTYLRKCTQFLAGELMIFDGGTVCAFCTATLNEYAESSMKDQIYKFARYICSVFFLQVDRYSVKFDILMCVLDSLAQKCKVEVEIWGTELVELVAYCASKCHAATTISCSTFAECLNDLAGVFCQVMTPLEMIIRLYAIGLSFIDHNAKSMIGDVMPSKGAKDEHAVGILDGVTLCNLTPVLGSLRSYFYDNCEEHCVSCGIDYQDLASDIHLDSHHGTSLNCTQKSREVYLLAYLNVLKFLCKPLSERVISQNKQIIFESDVASLSMTLCSIQEAFHQFSDIVLYFHRNKSKREAAGFDENKMILTVSVATFILSSRTKHKLQKSVHLIKQIIASEWIQPQGLKYISASLYSVGLLLYRNKQVNEALKPLKLCCRASWKCVKLLSEMSMQKSEGFVGDLSEDAILDFVTEACNQTVFLLDVLHKSGSLRVKKIIVNSLENWSAAEDLFRRLSGPVPLVKQWVKMQCENNKNMIVDDDAPTLYCLLSSSMRVSKRTIGKILQQELLAYEEMYAVHPEFCQRMQMEVIDILLKDVYVTDSHLQKSRVLIRKGRALRSCGSEGLEDCIQCLSEAISVINDESCSHGTPACHHLAVTYCLRALCTQEVEPNSKQVFQDIKAALDLWLSIPILDYGIAYDEGIMSPDSALLFLYNIVDLLAMKGSMEFHNGIYKLMIRLFEWKNVQLEMCLSILWESRRLTHALCVSPVNEALIMTSPGFSGEQFRSIDSWIHCLKGSPPLLVGFQHNFSYLFTNFHCDPDNHKPYKSDITVDDVKEATFKLISSVPATSYSFFIAGHLYYDLCERLIANGRLFEALSYAKDAHRLRTKLFKEKFMYTVEKQSENCTGAGSDMQKHTYGLSDVRMQKSVACEVWSFDNLPQDMDACYLSPWKILQCYLESTLQVGTIHELIGNGNEAEIFLRWGKDISRSQCLPLFIVAFSSVLGKLYCNKGSWDLSEKELQNAKHVLVHGCADFSCLKCGLMLEATIDQRLGDLSYSLFNTTRSIERLSLAESLYRSALDRLGHPEWKNSVSYSKDVEETEGASVCFPTCQVGSKLKMESQKCRKTKKATKCLLKEQSSVTEHNPRLTRSRYHSFQNQKVDSSAEVQVGPLNQLKGNKTCDIVDPNGQRQWLSGRKGCMVDLGCEIICICNGKKCWFCLAREVKESGLLSNFIYLKWEFARRRLSIRLLSGIGKCLEIQGRFHEAHEIISQSISVLVSRNPFTHARIPFTFLLDLVGKEVPGDVFSIERAAVLYDISWCSLKSYSSKDNGTICCDLYHVQVPKIVSWLMLAFVLCRQVPAVLQKVSRLLSAIFVLSSSSKTFSLSNYSKVLSESHWASFFHQASLGNNLNCQFLSNTTLKHKAQNFADDQGSCVTASAWEGAETCNLPRLAPESFQDLEQFVTEFYSGLPCTTVICISVIGGPCANLLKDLLQYPSCISAWMLLSRLKFKSQPVMMLLPVNKVLEETSDDDCAMSCPGEFLASNNLDKHWHCPWGLTVVDDVAPTFRFILEENYLSSSKFPLEDTKENRNLWWAKRKELDHRLGKLLRKIEDSWLGPWRCVLLGDWFNCSRLDSIMKKLVHDLKSKCKINTNESFLKVILQGARHSFNEEACISSLMSLKKGCFIAQAGYSEEKRCETFSEVSEGAEKLSDLAAQFVYNAVNELQEEESTIREPVILVLDYEVQMLPWENIPILRNQEVYRMPSVGSICFTLDRSCRQQEQVDKFTTAFPLIDPLDAFYLLNPGGDLSSTQVEFENWFIDQNLEGKAGSAPTSEELSSALKNHDLFIYFGHGSGAQYISQQEIQKLENCAATLLMGCSSGSLSLNGCYAPQGTALSYLLAGSPAIVANLWEVTDKDIDRFGKAMLDAWLEERSSVSLGCDQCNLVAKEFEAMNIKAGKGKAKKKVPKTKAAGTFDGGAVINSCDHRPKIGAFMAQAREACTLPFLIGASPVCYGIPTSIGIKKDL